MNKANGKDDDYVGAGFRRLDKKLLPSHPPTIRWGDLYKKWPEGQKLTYLEKLASSMNHAAHLIQTERDDLFQVCLKKEAQIQSLKEAIDQNNSMIQGEITRMNADRQGYNKLIADLNSELRKFDHGNIR